jgi:hypothetical protein
MGGFSVYVQTWESRIPDSTHPGSIRGSGLGRIVFDCQSPAQLPFPGRRLVDQTLKVVPEVQNPDREISLAEALKIDPQAVAGSNLTVEVPAGLASSAEIAQAVNTSIHWQSNPAGGVVVSLVDLTIAVDSATGKGKVVSGKAVYPASSPNPEPATLTFHGFTATLNSLTVTPQGAEADALLQMPESVVDPGTGHPGQIQLGTFQITPECVFRKDLPSFSYGPWAIGDTEIQIKGSGVVADFDPAWAPPSAPAGTAAASPAWEGVLLGAGNTVSALGSTVVSNSGYVRANYSYPWAQVAGAGLTAGLSLTAPFTFETLQPFGYKVEIGKGSIDLADSGIASGEFGSDKITAPPKAVSDETGEPLAVLAAKLTLNSHLDLIGRVEAGTGIRWGEYSTQTPAASFRFYRSQQFSHAWFYIAGTNTQNYSPVDAHDQFVEPSLQCEEPMPGDLQGLTLCYPNALEVDTPDTPGRAALTFVSAGGADSKNPSWVNVSFDGVHGSFRGFVSQPTVPLNLGPVGQPFYVGVAPFVALSGPALTPVAVLPTPHCTLSMQVVSSSVYDADMEGTIALPQPVGGNLDFNHMEFTSTAQISGAQVPLQAPLPLSYWGVNLVKKPAASNAAVISVRTGQIFFTAAGISETRHFAQPFYLTWGEMLANGTLHRLDFDYNSAGQRFDGFSFVPTFLKLSDYVPGTSAYLKVAGNISFDFFGAKYINLNDVYDPTASSSPFNNRRVALMSDSDPQGAYQPSDQKLNGNWSNGFGTFAFTYNYITTAQDGFLGTGTAGLQWITGSLPASIVMQADPQKCIFIRDDTHHDTALGPVAAFATLGRISGCGCINNGQLQRIMLTAELESDANANVFIKSASYGSVQIMLTPSVSQLEVEGDMFLTILLAGNIEVTGAGIFSVDRDQASVDGNVDGHFDASGALGTTSFSADGQLDWHAAAPVSGSSYQSLQGKLSVNIMMPVGGAGVEGGLYIGVNAPKSDAWILNAMDPRFKLNTVPLPDQLTGVFAYGKFSDSVSLWVVSGGVEAYTGLGGFVLPPNFPTGPLNAVASGVGFPYVVGNAGVHVWGEILGGLGSADGWVDLNVIAPAPFSYQGTLGLQACGLWVFCGTAEVTAGLNSSQGLYVQ